MFFYENPACAVELLTGKHPDLDLKQEQIKITTGVCC